MKYLDLFSGIGGMAMAAQWAGFELAGFSEVEPYCCAILAQHWPDVTNHGDIRSFDWSVCRGTIDVIGGGFPCQPFSAAGKRRGKDDDRNLWPAMRSVIEVVKPLWCICENVPGLLSMGEFDGICDDLEALGFEFAIFNVPANAVGAKHLRYRVFIVAHRACELFDRSRDARQGGRLEPADSGQTLADAESGIRQRETRREAGYSAQCSETLADSDRARLEEHQPREPGQLATLVGSGGTNRSWEFKPGICGNFARLSDWPHPLTRERIPHRAARLKALGNSCVPAQCLPFFQAIAQTIRIAELREQANES